MSRAEHVGWDEQSEHDFGEGELQLFNLVEKLDREWTSADSPVYPSEAIAQLERIKAVVNFMLMAAKWAR